MISHELHEFARIIGSTGFGWVIVGRASSPTLLPHNSSRWKRDLRRFPLDLGEPNYSNHLVTFVAKNSWAS
jgi:hypothetical protein